MLDEGTIHFRPLVAPLGKGFEISETYAGPFITSRRIQIRHIKSRACIEFNVGLIDEAEALLRLRRSMGLNP